MAKVIHVHVFAGHKDYYFGSIAAIFTVLKPQQIGITPGYIYQIGLAEGTTYTNTKCIIRQAEIITCKRT